MRLLDVKIQKVNYVTSSYDNILTFSIVNALSSDQFIFKGIDGVSSSDVDVAIVNTLQNRGVYQGSRTQNKELVIRVGLNPNYGLNMTASGLREYFYKLLTGPDAIRVILDTENETGPFYVWTEGHVKRVEASVFTPEPEVQITISTLYPYLISSYSTSLNLGTDTDFVVNRIGSAPAGFTFLFHLGQSVNDLTLSTAANYLNSSRIEMRIVRSIISDSVVTINTDPGNRAVYYQLPGDSQKYDLLRYVQLGSKWLMLDKSEQRFSLRCNGNSLLTLASSSSIAYTPKYWGI